MDEPKRPQLRHVDGPLRAAPIKPLTPQPLPTAGVQTPEPALTKPVFEYKKAQTGRRKLRPSKKIILAAAGLIGVVALFFGIKILLATNKIITRNNTGGAPALAGAIDPTKLKGEGDGRINILLLGIGGVGHPGGTLTDTMMIASIDPRTKNVALLSIPRDLWVAIPGYGNAKINAANAYGGPDLAKTVVAKVFNIPIHYYVLADFEGFRMAVDQVGGIDVVNQYNLSDSNYPCDDESGRVCPYYLAAGSYHLNGTQALKYVRCREGTCGTNFGREDRQRQSLLGLRQKALGISTLTNPAKIASLIDIIGGHLKTDLQISDMVKLAQMAKDIDPNKVINKGLIDYTYSDMVSGQSVVLPKTGNYSQIQDFVHSIFIDSYIKDENAAIEIQNGSSRAGLATSVATTLKGYQYNIVSATTADNQNYPSNVIYDYTSGKKPYTVSYLENRFGVKAQKATRPSGDTADIRIILGADYRAPAAGN